MSTENLEIEPEVEGEEEKTKEHKRKVSEYERGYRVGWNKGRAFVYKKLGIRPSEVEKGLVKIEPSELLDSKEGGVLGNSKTTVITAIIIGLILGLVAYYFVFRTRNREPNQ
ncbi:hypothetical protein B9Q01_10705 [Candidatus Marsarchaeota G1 archaeon OSP_D]|jgi:hypothetical protein|uniref:Uncharacterized protein n=1 Tax=Candidatus Marsarchaeota G1 archaeon OSP_D TaxID=1978155 RepID=A0A2R6A5P6_9ARCH|nr:MAG: hypothetical protein B9Q01_10705 [Candidatus Marsarchaeota G1 archaeon OSP_D]